MGLDRKFCRIAFDCITTDLVLPDHIIRSISMYFISFLNSASSLLSCKTTNEAIILSNEDFLQTKCNVGNFVSPTCAVLHEVLHYLIFELRPFICGGFRLSLNRQIFSRLDDLSSSFFILNFSLPLSK